MEKLKPGTVYEAFAMLRKNASEGEFLDLDLVSFDRAALHSIARQKMDRESSEYKKRNPTSRRVKIKIKIES